MACLPDYAELHCLSNFSFLRGASHPGELVERAAALGYAALAITDECSLAGAVRAHQQAKECGFKLILGTEIVLEKSLKLVLLATDRRSYGAISALITTGRRRSKKGSYSLSRADVEALSGSGALVLWVPAEDSGPALWLRQYFANHAWIVAELHCGPHDRSKLSFLKEISKKSGLPLVAAGDVHMHLRSRRRLQDVLTAVRLGRPVAQCGHSLFPNAERHLRLRMRLAQLYPEELLAESVAIARRCKFSLDELRYEYPQELVPAGETPASWLRKLTADGLRWRFPAGVPANVEKLVEHELALVAELGYEPFFLTVHDVVRFARGKGILCQGRGSAANSVVCYALGITEVDPARMNMLFERFVSKERDEPPDIDVDFEHQRREEVIQYVYVKYGRSRAALAATVICYRPKSAVRDVGSALGLPPEEVDRLAKSFVFWDSRASLPEHLHGQLLEVVDTLIGFPRHLSQHVGGFVISRGALAGLVPIENAAMPERTVIQWDKDDLEALGLLKVDVLALGMLSAIRRALDFVGMKMQDVPAEDPAVYQMIQKADTVGVFQIESRAQMSMLPRLKPASFYDLVIEVAIVRPGPIQGGMVHPYLRRRRGLEPVAYPSPEVERVLKRTLGVPIFQEQVMELAMVAAGFTPGEADRLRRSMAAWKKKGGLEHFEPRLKSGMQRNGYTPQFADAIYRQILGFGEYGFPECVVGQTRVIDAGTGRWVMIEDVVQGRARLRATVVCDEGLRIRKRRVLKVTKSGQRPVFKIHTALGRWVVGTAEHPLLTMSGWRPLGSLRPGDHIAAARRLPALGKKHWPRHEIIVLADLLAEGNLCHPRTLYFYTTSPLHRDEFIRCVERFPNTRATIALHRTSYSIHVRRKDAARPTGVVEWAQRLGLWGAGAHEKRMPDELFELHASDLALLLARLWEGDGHLSEARHATYDTVSRQLAEQIQHLLLRLGTVSRLYERTRPYRNRTVTGFTVTVTGSDNLLRFYWLIGRRFLDPAKRRFARALVTGLNGKHRVGNSERIGNGRMSRDIIPAAVREVIRRERDRCGMTWAEIASATGLAIREIQGRSSAKIGFRRWVIARLSRYLRSKELMRLATSDVYWDRVTAIKPLGVQETYDLHVEGEHNFLANDLVVHNSHAASFALLVYVSSWLKRHHPAAFCAALLNSQPMGFYAPSQLVQDARRHGVEVRPPDVTASDWDCTLEQGALRLGLRMVSGLSEAGGKLVAAGRPYAAVSDLGLNRKDLRCLAAAGALRSLAGHRRLAHWVAAGAARRAPLDAPAAERLPALAPPREGEDIVADYASLGLTLGRHPLALLRGHLDKLKLLTAEELRSRPHGSTARAAGLVTCRQRPDTASGVVFVTLEDETGCMNVVVWRRLVDRQRRELLGARLLGVQGVIERDGDVVHLVARRFYDYTSLLGLLAIASRDFH